MTSIKCDDCDVMLEAGGRSELEDVALRHYGEAHAGFDVSRTVIQNWFDAVERIGPPPPRVDALGTVHVRRVTPSDAETVLTFLGGDGFSDNPGWASCYCSFYHRNDPQGESSAPWREVRGYMLERLTTGATTGYLV